MAYIDVNSGQVIAKADGDTRQRFIRKTYIHLAAAIALFAVFEAIMIQMNLHIAAIKLISTVGGFGWLGIMLLYGFASNMMHNKAMQSISLASQYAAWAVGILLFSLLILPMIGIAWVYAPSVLQNAAVVTAALVIGLTAVVFTTGKDFSFLRPALTIGFFIALGVIVVSILFGFSLGTFFSGAMIVFAAGAILYETSQIQYHYHESQYVGASLSLFSSVGMLFWYVLQFMMAFTGSD